MRRKEHCSRVLMASPQSRCSLICTLSDRPDRWLPNEGYPEPKIRFSLGTCRASPYRFLSKWLAPFGTEVCVTGRETKKGLRGGGCRAKIQSGPAFRPRRDPAGRFTPRPRISRISAVNALIVHSSPNQLLPTNAHQWAQVPGSTRSRSRPRRLKTAGGSTRSRSRPRGAEDLTGGFGMKNGGSRFS